MKALEGIAATGSDRFAEDEITKHLADFDAFVSAIAGSFFEE